MEDRFAGVRVFARDDDDYVALSDGSVVHLHEYDRLYSVPGLYEHIVQDRLECQSPRVAAAGFMRAVSALGLDPAGLVLLDVGAGTGLVGALLRDAGVVSVVGVDPLPAAREACVRDRPGVYSDYLVGDLGGGLAARLGGHGVGGVVSAGAFGGTHGPPAVLVNALSLLAAGAPVAFTIDERWMRRSDPNGFGVAVERLVGGGRLSLLERSRFQHRVTAAGKPIYYELVVAVTG